MNKDEESQFTRSRRKIYVQLIRVRGKVRFVCVLAGGENFRQVLLPFAILSALMINSRLAMCPRGKYQYHVYRLINKQTNKRPYERCERV